MDGEREEAMQLHAAAQTAIAAALQGPPAAVIPVAMPKPMRAVVLAPGALSDPAALIELTRHASPNGMILALLAERPDLALVPERRLPNGVFLWVVTTLATTDPLCDPLPLAEVAEIVRGIAPTA